MVMRRAKALEHILTKMDIYIQDWERIVGSERVLSTRSLLRHRHELAVGQQDCKGPGRANPMDDAGQAELAGEAH